MTTAIEIRAQVDRLLREHKINYTCEFVPQRLSRNASEKTRTLNWKITFAYEPNVSPAAIILDYQQGIGHAPNPEKLKQNTIAKVEMEDVASETGRVGHTRLIGPAAADVLYSVCLDSTENYSCFEQWAADIGFDTDSRKAEQIYNDCKIQTARAVKLFGSALFAELAELVREL